MSYSEEFRVTHFLLQLTHPILLGIFAGQRSLGLPDVLENILAELQRLGSVVSLGGLTLPKSLKLVFLVVQWSITHVSTCKAATGTPLITMPKSTKTHRSPLRIATALGLRGEGSADRSIITKAEPEFRS